MNNVVTQRFIKCHDKLREDNRIRSSRQFAMALDYLPQSLSEILKGRRDVTIDLLRKAVEKYKINPVYLITGEGPLFMTEEDRQDFRILTIVTNPEETERIVHVPNTAQAGYAEASGNPVFVENLPTFSLPDYRYKVGTYRSFDVTGEGMEPTLMEGDKVVCSFLEPSLWGTSIKDNYVYVLVTRGDVLVRRVVNLIPDRRQLRLLSDNLFYDPFVISLGEVREIWYVRSKISPFLAAPKSQAISLHNGLTYLQRVVQGQHDLVRKLQAAIEQLAEKTN